MQPYKRTFNLYQAPKTKIETPKPTLQDYNSLQDFKIAIRKYYQIRKDQHDNNN